MFEVSFSNLGVRRANLRIQVGSLGQTVQEQTIVSSDLPESFVAVYSTPLEFDAGLVKAMLADEEIPSTVENANGPFPGISAAPCQVLVSAEHEVRARELVAEHEARHRERVMHESDTEDGMEDDFV